MVGRKAINKGPDSKHRDSMAPSFSSTVPIYSSTLSPHHTPWKTANSSILVKLDSKPSLLCCSSKKKTSFIDQILDYIEGGPKLRKWYGAPDLLPKDGVLADEEDEYAGVEETRDAVLVTDGDSEIGQMVILSLIVKRVRVKALVKDKRAAIEAFGTYVESISGDASNKAVFKKALRGVRAIICPNDGFLSNVGSVKGVEHIVLLSQLAAYRSSSGIQALMTGNMRKLAEQDESVVVASGIPYTIIRAGLLQNSPGGVQGFSFKEGSAAQGRLSKEDAAFICVEALDAVPQRGLIFEVANGEEKVSDWKQCFATLIEKAEQQPLQ
ncbi:PREDICTED: uncharacterized protein LOC104609342 isoform X1 [Nelumbo nucifera]|uniref:Uncharacterized protein LOC104609342 isoform X1 n=1 Tax=Nelumbo nucifera TaxID=4432 RepID=A0A1U8BBM7_NELNU|nr:PREDICTED: uncharacterized protein LOC104609342 isoform X1 [Nelumbo nucifera]